MKPNNDAILTELIELAEQIGYRIRYERGDFNGGYCLLKEQRLIIVNKKFEPKRKITILAKTLSEIGIENIYIKPALREVIEEEVIKNEV
jgi:hypothetical protein